MTTVQKWGNSLGIRLPKALAKELRLNVGSLVTIRESKGTLVIRPVAQNRRYRLEDLVAGIIPKNRHALLLDEGEALVGNEAW